MTYFKHLPLNIITNIASFVLSTIIGIFLTPFFIKNLGTEGLGIIRIAFTVPAYIGLLTLIINGAVSRFLLIDLNRNDYVNANKTFNTAFFSLTVLLIFIIPIIIIISYKINIFLKIPINLETQTIYLFLGVLFASLLEIFSSLFMIPAYANNRLDVINITKIVTIISRTTLVFILIIYFYKSLISVGFSFFIGALFGLIISIKIWKNFAPFLKLSIEKFDFNKIKEMSNMGIWLFVDQIGIILFFHLDLILVNYLLGAKPTGEYSIVLQWQTMLRSLASVLVGAITPMLLISYSKKEYKNLINISYLSVKFLGLALAIPIGLITGFAPTLLKIWVGEEFTSLYPLLWLMLFPLVINLSYSALFSINIAYNSIKFPSIVTLITGGISFLLALFFTKFLDFGLYGIALAGIIVFSMRNLFFIVLYVSKMINSRALQYYKNTFFGIFTMLTTFFISFYFQYFININSWTKLLSSILVITAIILLFIWFALLSSNEKRIIINIVFKRRVLK